jgi:hypothetical protein
VIEIFWANANDIALLGAKINVSWVIVNVIGIVKVVTAEFRSSTVIVAFVVPAAVGIPLIVNNRPDPVSFSPFGIFAYDLLSVPPFEYPAVDTVKLYWIIALPTIPDMLDGAPDAIKYA